MTIVCFRAFTIGHKIFNNWNLTWNLLKQVVYWIGRWEKDPEWGNRWFLVWLEYLIWSTSMIATTRLIEDEQVERDSWTYLLDKKPIGARERREEDNVNEYIKRCYHHLDPVTCVWSGPNWTCLVVTPGLHCHPYSLRNRMTNCLVKEPFIFQCSGVDEFSKCNPFLMISCPPVAHDYITYFKTKVNIQK